MVAKFVKLSSAATCGKIPFINSCIRIVHVADLISCYLNTVLTALVVSAVCVCVCTSCVSNVLSAYKCGFANVTVM